MHSFILQDWITIRGTTSNNVIQGESSYLDLAPYQDITFYLDVREVSATPASLQYQTAPIRDEVLFQSMMATPITLSAPSTTVTHVPITTAACPIARFVRWQLLGPAAAWDVTFRVLAAATALGL